MRVFVVSAEFGEYEQTTFGLCGVFSSRAAAEGHVSTIRSGRETYMRWHDEFCKEINKRGRTYAMPFDGRAHDLVVAEARNHVPPEPPHFMAERFEIIELDLDQPVDWVSASPE